MNVEDLGDAGQADAARQVDVLRHAQVDAMQRQAAQRVARRDLAGAMTGRRSDRDGTVSVLVGDGGDRGIVSAS